MRTLDATRIFAWLFVLCMTAIGNRVNAVAPRIIAFSPDVKYVAVHGRYSFHVTAIGTHRAYQWWHQEPDAAQGHPIPVEEGFGSNRRRLVVAPAQATRDYNGWYWCVVSNTLTGESTESPRGQVFVIEAPAVTQDPESQTVSVGGSVSFSIVADPHGPVPTKYRWYLNGHPIVHANQSTLEIPSVTARRAGFYTCRVRTLGGTTMSDGAILTVQP